MIKINNSDDIIGIFDENYEHRNKEERNKAKNQKWFPITKENYNKRICFFTEEQRQMIESSLMNDQAEGVFNTKKSKKNYNKIFEELDKFYIENLDTSESKEGKEDGK